MKISDKIRSWMEEHPTKTYFSFEYFPPKTDLGTMNLYERFGRMASYQPMWVDVTWGAGGSTAERTFDICTHAHKYYGLDVMMHLTCTGMKKVELKEVLQKCKEIGIMNILALRGDPPKENEEWTATEGGFRYASDLVTFIRQEFGDYFCIGVAGYPEGHLEATSFDDDFGHLVTKVNCGADLIVTQLFYQGSVFVDYVGKCRAAGINVPILPGIMPIQSYSGFIRMTEFCKTLVPKEIHEALEPIKSDDSKVKAYGVELACQMCQELLDANVTQGFHFYTLNLETSVLQIINKMNLFDSWTSTRKLPWTQVADQTRADENVRPIFWGNRPESYIRRTATWDDFPNGRFGNRSSPAYGEWTFVSYSKESWEKIKADRVKMWGAAPTKIEEIQGVFKKFLNNEDCKRLPWCIEAPGKETNFVLPQLERLISLGLLTINSQPRVNAQLSSDPYVGWGPSDGFVYQKAYVEFFTSEENVKKILKGVDEEKLRSLQLMAYNRNGDILGSPSVLSDLQKKKRTVNALTWGCFPNSEVMQPTVCDNESFRSWKDEAFALWKEWEDIYDDGTESKKLLQDVTSKYYLVNIVDNDYVSGDLFTHLVKILADDPF